MIKKDVAGRSVASFGRTHKKQFQVVLGIVAAAAIYALYQVRTEAYLNANGEVELIFLLFPVLVFGGAIGKVLFDVYQDMPYLCFREDHFFLEGDKGEKKYYWRDVEDIKEVTLMDRGMPRPDIVVLVVFKDNSQVEFDPRAINFASADVGAIAREFWQNAQARISS